MLSAGVDGAVTRFAPTGRLERLSHPRAVFRQGGRSGSAPLNVQTQETCTMFVLVKTATLYADLAHTSLKRSCGCKWTSDKAKATRFADAGKAAKEMARRSVADFSIEDDCAKGAVAGRPSP
jgi:hypothetical protein